MNAYVEPKPLIQDLLGPKKHVWTKVPIGFIVRTTAPIGQAHWYVNGVDRSGQKETFDYTFQKADTYLVKVVVFDTEGGTDSREISVTVDDQPECTLFNLDQRKSAVQISEYDKKISFQINLSGYGETFQSIYWDWGDHQTLDAPTPPEILNLGAQNPTHDYTKEGEHYGTITVSTASKKSCTMRFFVIVG